MSIMVRITILPVFKAANLVSDVEEEIMRRIPAHNLPQGVFVVTVPPRSYGKFPVASICQDADYCLAVRGPPELLPLPAPDNV